MDKMGKGGAEKHREKGSFWRALYINSRARVKRPRAKFVNIPIDRRGAML